MPEQELSENARAALQAQQEASQKSREEYAERTKGRPTPTQQENDEAAMGKHFEKLSEDGADLDLGAVPLEHRHLQPEHGQRGGYQTRQSQPQSTQHRPVQPRPPSQSSS